MKTMGKGTWALIAITVLSVFFLVVLDVGRAWSLFVIALLVVSWLVRNHMILVEWLTNVFREDSSPEYQAKKFYTAVIQIFSEIKWLLYVIVALLAMIAFDLFPK